MTFTSLALTLLVAASPGGKARIAVLGLNGAGDVDAKVAAAMTEAITAEIAARGYFEPISAGEIATLLGFERQKQLLGCGEDSSTCVTEIAAALGAPWVMTGSLTRLEGLFQLNLQVVDTQKARTLSRSTRIAKDFESLRGLIPWAVAEACGTPLPPAPSRVLPITLLSTGAVSLIAGGVVGFIALNTESTVSGELKADDGNTTVVLNSADRYRERLAQTAMLRTVSLAALLAGAALVGLGIVLMPGDSPQAGVRVSLLPTPGGVAVVGVMP